jgi:ribosomal protein S18 acetylase RimI-like enzyme
MSTKVNVEFREANVLDAQGMQHVNEVTFCKAENYSSDQWKYLLSSNDSSSVVYKERNIVAYILACCFDEGQLNGEIVSLAVLPKYRNKKIGSELVDMSIEALRKYCKTVSLCVRSKNQVAIKLYESKGFVKKSTVSGYYGDDDAHRMTIELGSLRRHD